jgi:NADPH:quinone reductase-like Zn-dependent oxidoreductase
MKTMKVMRFNDSTDAPALIAATAPVPPQELSEIARLLDRGDLKICVDGVVPLAQASAAYLGTAGRKLGRGKVVITLIEEASE